MTHQYQDARRRTAFYRNTAQCFGYGRPCAYYPLCRANGDQAYRLCTDYVCAKFKIDHESDLGYGKGYALVNNEFIR